MPRLLNATTIVGGLTTDTLVANDNVTFNDRVRGAGGIYVTNSLYAMLGEGFGDLSMTGLYDRNELNNAAMRGTVTVALTGAGTAPTGEANFNKLFAGVPGNFYSLSGVDATTTQFVVQVDMGSLQPNYSNAAWQPFIQYRFAAGSVFSYFKSIVVEVSPDGSAWSKAAGGGWETTDISANSIGPSLWMGTNAIPSGMVGSQWRYVRFTFSSISIGASNPTSIWISQIGLRHANGPFARQYLLTAGDTMYGNLVLSGANLSTSGGTVANDNTANLLRVLGTMPLTPTAFVQGVNIDITSAGSASQVNWGMRVNFGAGYTGASSTTALGVTNSVAGTAGTIIKSGSPDGNSGISFTALGVTTGYNYGVSGFARQGDISIGGLFRAGFNTLTSGNYKAGAVYIGSMGVASNVATSGGKQIGGYFSLDQVDPTFVSAALIADNGTATDPIFVARDNGAAVFAVNDGGGIIASAVVGMGLGVSTLQAWGAGFTPFELFGNNYLVGANLYTLFSHNAYFDGAQWRYKTTDTATVWTQGYLGAHNFYVTPSGTAGAAITWAAPLTINNDGTLSIAGGLLLGDGTNLVLGTTTGTKIGTATTQKIGFWNATPIVRPAAWTQTYATATRTVATPTALTQSTVYSGIASGVAGTPYAQLTSLNALRAEYEHLRADVLNALGLINQLIDDDQLLGLRG